MIEAWNAMILEFLSTPSARRATKPSAPSPGSRWNFYPRPPRGGRLRGTNGDQVRHTFLSTPSARRATSLTDEERRELIISIHALREEGDQHQKHTREDFIISIHALREEGDTAAKSTSSTILYFYPRPPRGGRQAGTWPSSKTD